MKNTILLIVASQGYQPIEYGKTRKTLEDAGFTVKVASDKAAKADALPSIAHAKVCDDPECRDIVKKHPEYANAHIDLLVSTIKTTDYDGIFLIGGPGALEFLDNQETYNVMQTAEKAGKHFGAICISPRILAHAGLLKGKKATGWDSDHKLAGVFRECGVTYDKKPVVTDGKIVTADGPSSAEEFGRAIATAMKKLNA